MVTLAQSVSTQIGAKPAGMGYASATSTDSYSILNNVAGIANLVTTEFAAAYDAAPSLSGADRMAAIANLKLKSFVMGVSLFRFGDDLYNEQLLTIGAANKLGIAALGVRLILIQYQAQGFGIKTSISADLGGLVEFTKKLALGAYITNLNQPSLSKESGERLPTKLHAGVGFYPSDSFSVCVEIDKDIDYSPTWKAGFEYQFRKRLSLRSGYNLNPNAAFFGLGFNTSRLRLDYALRHSYSLGMSHQASAIFSIRKK
jgi:hypothetical protein